MQKGKKWIISKYNLSHSQRFMSRASKIFAFLLIMHLQHIFCAPETKIRRLDKNSSSTTKAADVDIDKPNVAWKPRDILYIEIQMKKTPLFMIFKTQMGVQNSRSLHAEGTFDVIEEKLKEKVNEQKQKEEEIIWVRIMETPNFDFPSCKATCFLFDSFFSIIGRNKTTIIEIVNRLQTVPFKIKNNEKALEELRREKETKVFQKLEYWRTKESIMVLLNPVFGMYHICKNKFHYDQLIRSIKKISSRYTELFCMFDQYSIVCSSGKRLSSFFFEYFPNLFPSSIQSLVLIMLNVNLQITPSKLLPIIFDLKLTGNLTICTPHKTRIEKRITKEIFFSRINIPKCVAVSIDEKILRKYANAGNTIVIRHTNIPDLLDILRKIRSKHHNFSLYTLYDKKNKMRPQILSQMSKELTDIVKDLYHLNSIKYCRPEVAVVFDMEDDQSRPIYYNAIILVQKKKKQKEPRNSPIKSETSLDPCSYASQSSLNSPSVSKQEETQTIQPASSISEDKRDTNPLLSNSNGALQPNEGLQSAYDSLDLNSLNVIPNEQKTSIESIPRPSPGISPVEILSLTEEEQDSLNQMLLGDLDDFFMSGIDSTHRY